jgi:1-acyl-sn-glycerol-3-phosphate acyltransferase
MRGIIGSLSSAFHSLANRAASLLMKLLFGYAARVHVIRGESVPREGGFLLAANHISHFDPFIISSVVRRKIDWMTMAEFFPIPVVGLLLRAVDAFPAERVRADRKTIRTAIERVGSGRVVGLFPEGGIRNGQSSVLEGAATRPGAATLAHIAAIPILPCIIVGSDRLYSTKNWLPLRRTPIWIAFGDPISHFPELKKTDARECIERKLISAFKNLYAELRERFKLTPDDLPHSPQERMRCSRHALSGRSSYGTATQLRKPSRVGGRGYINLQRFNASAVDSLMCASMNILQSRHRLHGRSRDEMERYIEECETLTAQQFYAVPPNGEFAGRFANHRNVITWPSPIKTKFPANNIARVDFFPCKIRWPAPTVFMLHSLLSASRIGYFRCAARLNKLGWNACFVHLPYHYSRAPRGYWNGELAITADLIRNAEALRQGVIELRQLMAALREMGSTDFGVLGTSYGGWIGALLAMVEGDLRFLALMAPIVNVEHAVWQNRATAFMRRELRRANIEPSLIRRHFHLSSPMHNDPVCSGDRVLFVSGNFDSIALANDIERIHQRWRGSQLLRVPQGHFGYRMMRETLAWLQERAILNL